MMLTYEYEQITYCVRLVKPILTNSWEVIVEGLIAPKKKLPVFTHKFQIVQPGTILHAKEDKLKIKMRVTGLVVDPIRYINYQIYLYEEDGQIEEAKKWKTYSLQFLPSVINGGVA
jgi:hypothetical protein